MIEHAGNNARIIRGVLGADIIALLEVWRRAGFERLALQRLVAAVGFRLGLVDFGFLRRRQSKEGRGFPKNVVDKRLGDAVILDVEESLVEAGRAQLRDRPLADRPTFLLDRPEMSITGSEAAETLAASSALGICAPV